LVPFIADDDEGADKNGSDCNELATILSPHGSSIEEWLFSKSETTKRKAKALRGRKKKKMMRALSGCR
jgi:hypothetical protein